MRAGRALTRVLVVEGVHAREVDGERLEGGGQAEAALRALHARARAGSLRRGGGGGGRLGQLGRPILDAEYGARRGGGGPGLGRGSAAGLAGAAGPAGGGRAGSWRRAEPEARCAPGGGSGDGGGRGGGGGSGSGGGGGGATLWPAAPPAGRAGRARSSRSSQSAPPGGGGAARGGVGAGRVRAGPVLATPSPAGVRAPWEERAERVAPWSRGRAPGSGPTLHAAPDAGIQSPTETGLTRGRRQAQKGRTQSDQLTALGLPHRDPRIHT